MRLPFPWLGVMALNRGGTLVQPLQGLEVLCIDVTEKIS